MGDLDAKARISFEKFGIYDMKHSFSSPRYYRRTAVYDPNAFLFELDIIPERGNMICYRLLSPTL